MEYILYAAVADRHLAAQYLLKFKFYSHTMTSEAESEKMRILNSISVILLSLLLYFNFKAFERRSICALKMATN